MIARVFPGTPAPGARADAIYRAARAQLDDRLWQAALGTRAERAPASFAPMLTRRPITGLWLRTPAAPAPADTIGPADAPLSPDPLAVTEGAASGLGANARHGATLREAASRTGVPVEALAAIVDAEAAKGRDGAWNSLSRNPRSSAAGLGQFLSKTWEGLAETPGTWLNGVARTHGWLDAAGHTRSEARAAMLSLRYDSIAAINGVADFARRNLDGLARAGVGAGDDPRRIARLAYLGHHLGLSDAVRFLRDGELTGPRARALLDAQVGGAASRRRIEAAAGDAAAAHQMWLTAYVDRKIRPQRFASVEI